EIGTPTKRGVPRAHMMRRARPGCTSSGGRQERLATHYRKRPEVFGGVAAKDCSSALSCASEGHGLRGRRGVATPPYRRSMDIIERLHGTPLAPFANTIARSGAPAAELMPRPDLAPPTRAGATRFGGPPDLAPGVRWPQRGGRHLALVVQIDLCELASLTEPLGAPTAGVLSFF